MVDTVALSNLLLLPRAPSGAEPVPPREDFLRGGAGIFLKHFLDDLKVKEIADHRSGAWPNGYGLV